MTIDLTPLIQILGSVLATVLVTFASIALQKLATKFGLQANAQATAGLDDAARKAVSYGLSQVTGLIAARGWDHPTVKNEALAKAATYAIEKFPEALAAAGIDPQSPQAPQQIAGALARVFPAAATEAAASPATPSAGLTQATAPQGAVVAPVMPLPPAG